VRATQAEAEALRPLWRLTTGAALAAAASAAVAWPGPHWLTLALTLFGAAACAAALIPKSRPRSSLWLLAGLALVGGRGLAARADLLAYEALASTSGSAAVRARAVVVEGWSPSRWGWRARGRVEDAHSEGKLVKLPRACRLEIRGETSPNRLPPPGAVIEVLAAIRGQPQRPLLVVSSPRLIEDTGQRRLLPTFRDRLARSLLRAAGTHEGRIRAAELAAALALGRRDLVPAARRDRWRSAGLAHLLAVSGLPVGLVGGGVWLCSILLGAGPRAARLIVLAALPSYALLAGASPSALRAALMGVVYLGARLLGRAVLPMSAVLLAALVLLFAAPALIADAGFQLTVVITAALVRWVPPAARALPGPRWLTGAVAVPVVAQAAAAPLVAWHFRSLIPGAVLTNLLALPLLAPTVLASVAAALVAPMWPGAAVLVLDIVRLLAVGLNLASGPGRSLELVPPPLSAALALVLIVAGWLALQPGRRARVGVVGWLAANVLFAAVWLLPAVPQSDAVELLPVVDGAAVVVTSGGDSVLIDAGRYPRDASRMLASSARRRLRAVLLSHTDEDHVGGAAFVLRSTPVDCLILPRWMVAEAAAVPLLRAARRTRTRVIPIARGSAIQLGTIRLETIWPPAHDPPSEENERSLVARILTEHGVVLITSDVGRATENRLARLGHLGCDVLVVPHHGSRSSTSEGFLDAACPTVALVPAGPGNTYGHPHPEALARLTARQIPMRVPARDGWCGARYADGRWMAFP